MSISNALHHDGVSKASTSHAPVKSDLALPPPPPSKRVLWTEEEHRLFLQGVKQYGKGNWKKISENFVKSKTPVQVASHAQKYFIRQSSKVKKRKSIHDETLEIVQPSLNLNMNFRKQCQPDLPSHRHLNLNLNHPHIMPMPMPMPMQQDSTHHDCDQNRSVKNWWQQDSTHDNGNEENHSVPRPLQQVPAHHIRDISHPSKHQNQHNRNVYPPPNHLYIDMIIQKSDEGHLDIFVRDSNQVKVKSVLTLQGSPHHLDLSSQQIHIPYFCSQNLPPQQCRVMLKNIATQP